MAVPKPRGGVPPAALACIVLCLLSLQSLTGCLYHEEVKIVQLTRGPDTILREPDSIRLDDQLLVYHRTGTRQVRDNVTGLLQEVWDNGTYVVDLEADREERIGDGLLMPEVSSPHIVWRDRDGAIVLLNPYTDIREELPLSDAVPVSRPDIHGNRVVWADARHDPVRVDDVDIIDIYMFDITTQVETRLTTVESNKGPPSIWGDLVAWGDGRNGGFDIYALNITNGTEFRVTRDPSGQYNPKVSPRAIAWVDTRMTDHEWKEDVFYYDLADREEVQASFTGAVEAFDIWDDVIVFEDVSGKDRPFHKGDIFRHDISKNRTRRFFDSDWGQWSPATWGGRTVWADGSRDGGEVLTKERVERPIYGFDLMTLLLLIVICCAAAAGLLLFHRHTRREVRGTFEAKRRSKDIVPEAKGRKKGRGRERERKARARPARPRARPKAGVVIKHDTRGRRRAGRGRPPPGYRGRAGPRRR